jgi:hypothetical protein
MEQPMTLEELSDEGETEEVSDSSEPLPEL